MALGNNRDYKTRDRMARAQLAVHKEKMDELISQGWSKEVASKAAFEMITGGELRQAILQKAKEIN